MAGEGRLEAVCFDLGNTLMYFDASWPEALAEADFALLASLRSAGIPLEADRFLARFRSELDDYYRERDTEFIEHTTRYVLKTLLEAEGYGEPPEPVLRSALEALYRVTQAHWQPEPEALPLLRRLKAAGYRLALISNAGDDADVQALVDKAGIRPFFEAILTSAAVGIRKPNPRIFRLALEALAVSPNRAAMVGDTLGADVLGARNAGMRSIWITRRIDAPGNQAHAETIHPDAQIATLSELPAALEALGRG